MNFEQTMTAIADLQKRHQALNQQYNGLINLHASSYLLGNSDNEAKYRSELHETLEMLLDCQVQMCGLKVTE